ncbi:NAD(P)H dehydrogenase (quinone) [Saccharothrix coeruleofusca]|uniref:SDR family oxidoreductase n=1 Tax=Saccharothrix coeruleofusca TaxID=33919 RepID=UPI001AEACC61|nr:SDR family oxidoreductase [Saccharothrix coeruleofusca]MBP2336357.1 NAD(P)H dehydrogenase (quinone) [Saccharothrix coeruleofusca]
MSFVITGATGQLGRLVVTELLDRGVPADRIVAGGRNLDKITDLAALGVTTTRFDYDDPASMDAALSEGDTLLLISSDAVGTRVAQHRAVIGAAVRAGVSRLLYTSVLSAEGSPLVLAADHVETEQLIRDSGLPFTLLRNGWYTENYAPALQQAAATGEVLTSAGEGRVASATRADYAAATAGALVGQGHENKVYELSGDYAWDFDELAHAFSTLLGREVVHRGVTPEEHLAALLDAGVDEQTAGFLVALDAGTRAGALALTTGDLSRLAGRPSTALLDGLRPLLG